MEVQYIQKYLKAIHEIPKLYGKITSIENLKDGVTNVNFLVTTESHKLILKILDPRIEGARDIELKINSHLFKKDISPRILKSSLPNYFIIEYIESTNPTKQYFNKSSNLNKLLELLLLLHKQRIQVPELDLEKMNLLYIHGATKVPYYSDLIKIHNVLFTHIINFPINLALCHNDLNLNNILLDNNNKLWLIDFEFTSINDVFFDLATLKPHLNKISYNTLIQQYYELNSFNMSFSEFNSKIKYYELICSFTSLTWYLYMVNRNITNNSNTYLKLAKKEHTKLISNLDIYFNKKWYY